MAIDLIALFHETVRIVAFSAALALMAVTGFRLIHRTAGRFSRRLHGLQLAAFIVSAAFFTYLAGSKPDDLLQSPRGHFAAVGVDFGGEAESILNEQNGLRFTSIDVGTNSVALSAAWEDSLSLPGSVLDIFARQTLSADDRWSLAAVRSVSPGATSAVFSVVAAELPGGAVTNSMFFKLGTHADADGDGIFDARERLIHGTGAALFDTDGDSIADGEELALGLSPCRCDTDGDGFADATDPCPAVSNTWADVDHDGLPDEWKSHWFGTMPVTASSDLNSDGIGDVASLYIGVNPTNQPQDGFEVHSAAIPGEIAAWEIAPTAFTFVRPTGVDGLVRRTFSVNRTSPWQRFFVSSCPDRAAGWEMSGLRLSWGNGSEAAPYNVVPASSGDSYPLPLDDGEVGSLSFSLEATGAIPSLSRPLYLLRWTPRIVLESAPGVSVVEVGDARAVYAAAKRVPHSGRYEIPFSLDCSRYPHLAGMDAETSSSLYSSPGGGVTVEWGDPMRFVADDPVKLLLPQEGFSPSKTLVFYHMDVRWSGAIASGPRSSRFATPYPLDSTLLRRAFHRAEEKVANPGVEVTLSPVDPELSYEMTGAALRAPARGLRSSPGATAGSSVSVVATVCGIPCSNDCRVVEHEYPEEYEELHDEDDDRHEEGRGYETSDDECGCDADGSTSIGSFRLRIPLGEPAEGEVSGYLYSEVHEPRIVAADMFEVVGTEGVTRQIVDHGVEMVVCSDNGGRTLHVTNGNGSVSIPVWNASGRFECLWRVWNPGGDASTIRVRRETVLGSATLDETYRAWTEGEGWSFGYDYVVPSEVRAVAWERTDHLRNVRRVRREWPFAEELDAVAGVYEETYLGTTLTRRRFSEYILVGCGATAKRRLSAVRGRDEKGEYECWYDYYCDTDHPDRHARRKVAYSTRSPWRYYDYDEFGREICRIEQLDGSEFPRLAEVRLDVSLSVSAKITVTGYDPTFGDSSHRNDFFEPREIAEYVHRGGTPPVLVSRRTSTIARTEVGGTSLRRVETVCGVAPHTNVTAVVAHPDESAVPRHLRGREIYRCEADGGEMASAYELLPGGRMLRAVVRRSFNGVERPTYSVTDFDAAYRLPLREEMRLAADGVLLEWSENLYDDRNRLRSTRHSDGTSETNAYSCCRLLWSRDREGRKTLRSAETGRDDIYRAEEAVWLGDISSDGRFRVTSHAFDGFGRETNTITCLGSTAGAATVPREVGECACPSRRTTIYLDDHGSRTDCSVTEDGRGPYRVHEGEWRPDRVVSYDAVLNVARQVRRSSSVTRINNGGTIVRAEGAGHWREEHREIAYDDAGRSVDTVWTESDDYGSYTNSVAVSDILGRKLWEWTPTGEVTNVYDGTTARLVREEIVVGDLPPRRVERIYGECGEAVGAAEAGVTNRVDVTYEQFSNAWWKVTTQRMAGPEANVAQVVKTRLTGLGNGLRAQTIEISSAGLTTETTTTYDPTAAEDNRVEVKTERRSDGVWKTTRSIHGVTLSEETAAGRTLYTYDGFGRVVRTERIEGSGAGSAPVAEFTYSPWNEVVAEHSYTGGVGVVSTTYGYDGYGNRVAETNSLGEVVLADYDAFGNVTMKSGATYPVQMAYDSANRRVALRTTRDGSTWDETRWTYDPATGNPIAKTYADGSTVTHTYTPDGLPLRTTFASGHWTENIYNERRQKVGIVCDEASLDAAWRLDAFGRMVGESNAVLATALKLADAGDVTNECWTLDNIELEIRRENDDLGRRSVLFMPQQGYTQHLRYDENGALGVVSNDEAVVTYTYDEERHETGYGIAFANGGVFTRQIVRDPHRPDLVLALTNSIGGLSQGFAYEYDALSRPVTRNGDTFAYNIRSEVAAATIGGNHEEHAYDNIGNSVFAAFNGVSNTYTANNLNQYTSVGRVAPNAPPISPTYDADGNMTAYGPWTYAYDSNSRLVSVSSNGILLVTNFYDAKGRRVKKVTQNGTHVFIYDGWNLIYERVDHAAGGVDEFHYVWGKDLSGTLQGAGGIGGLLYIKYNGTIYVPYADAYGNITRYTDSAGNIAAEYTYDAFGRTISKTDLLAAAFRYRFSSKYYEVETGLYYYGYRFYSPGLRRWLNRDSIEEDGGINLYGFCSNNTICSYDKDGCAYFALRPLSSVPWLGLASHNSIDDFFNTEIAHEHLFFEDGKSPSDYGLHDDIEKDGRQIFHGEDASNYRHFERGYDDCVMRVAVANVKPQPYSVLGSLKTSKYNCQDYCSDLRREYFRLLLDNFIRKKCCIGSKNY